MALTQIQQDGLSANALAGIRANVFSSIISGGGAAISTTTNANNQTILTITVSESISPFMLSGL
jgi:hypothetical protein